MHMTMLFKSVQDPYSHTRCRGRHLWNCGMHEDNSLWGDIALLAEGRIERQDDLLRTDSLTVNLRFSANCSGSIRQEDKKIAW